MHTLRADAQEFNFSIHKSCRLAGGLTILSRKCFKIYAVYSITWHDGDLEQKIAFHRRLCVCEISTIITASAAERGTGSSLCKTHYLAPETTMICWRCTLPCLQEVLMFEKEYSKCQTELIGFSSPLLLLPLWLKITHSQVDCQADCIGRARGERLLIAHHHTHEKWVERGDEEKNNTKTEARKVDLNSLNIHTRLDRKERD